MAKKINVSAPTDNPGRKDLQAGIDFGEMEASIAHEAQACGATLSHRSAARCAPRRCSSWSADTRSDEIKRG